MRYVDDLIVLGDDKGRLSDIREQVRERLHLHPHKAWILATRLGVDVLGYRVFPNRRRLRDDNGHRFARKLRSMARAYAQGGIAWEKIDASVQAWIGHARHGETLRLRRKVFSGVVFRRPSDRPQRLVTDKRWE